MKSNLKRYKKPSLITYFFTSIIFKIFSKFKFNLKVIKNDVKKVKGPFVILANHESALDFVNIYTAIKRRAHFVISRAFYSTLPIRKIMDSMGVIPKNQFQTIPSDLKNMKTAITNGFPLVIYPAGLMPEDGIGTPIPKATGKALKWIGVDVYVAKSVGSYLTNPKWSSRWRKGRVKLSITKFLSKEELLNTLENEVQQKLEKELYFDAYKNNEIERVCFKHGDEVLGLENVLYKCPNCKSEFTIKAENKNTLKCCKCNYSVYADKMGFLYSKDNNVAIYKHPSDWSKFIENELLLQIKEDKNYTLQCDADVYMIDYKKGKFVCAGKTNLKLSRKGFEFDGIINNEKFVKNISISNFPTLPLKPGKSFEIQDGKDIYRILPMDKTVCTKWVSALEILYNLN